MITTYVRYMAVLQRIKHDVLTSYLVPLGVSASTSAGADLIAESGLQSHDARYIEELISADNNNANRLYAPRLNDRV